MNTPTPTIFGVSPPYLGMHSSVSTPSHKHRKNIYAQLLTMVSPNRCRLDSGRFASPKNAWALSKKPQHVMEIPNFCDPSHKKKSHHNQDHSKKNNIERYFEVKKRILQCLAAERCFSRANCLCLRRCWGVADGRFHMAFHLSSLKFRCCAIFWGTKILNRSRGQDF